MQFNEIHSLPKETENNVVFDAFFSSVSKDDIKNGTDPKCFAYANLIEWAITNKKFVEYYSYMKPFLYDDKKRGEIEEELKRSKTVIVRFNFVATPLFGLFGEDDGDNCLIFPTSDGLKCNFL